MAHTSASPCWLPVMPTPMQAVSVMGGQCWACCDQFEVLSRTIRTFGICDGMLGLVRNRSMSSPIRSTAAHAGADVATTRLANKLLRKVRVEDFMAVSLIAFIRAFMRGPRLRAVAGRLAYLDPLMDLGGRSDERVLGADLEVPVSVLRRHAGKRAVTRGRLEIRALGPEDRDGVRLDARRRGLPRAGGGVLCPEGCVAHALQVARPGALIEYGVVEEGELVDGDLDRLLRLRFHAP